MKTLFLEEKYAFDNLESLNSQEVKGVLVNWCHLSLMLNLISESASATKFRVIQALLINNKMLY